MLRLRRTVRGCAQHASGWLSAIEAGRSHRGYFRHASTAPHSALAGVEASGLEQVIRKSFELLNLISFFTFNQKEAHAWNVPRGANAPQAAGAIHTDFERGFIRAEVIPYEVFVKYGSSHTVKTAGLLLVEGKEYAVQDGDILYFRFNV